MKRVFAIIILTICSLTIAAQSQIYSLHPIVGDTIEKYEIDKYYLFSDYRCDSIDYLILYKNKELFSLAGISDSISLFNIQINEDEVQWQKERIEKLNNYYASTLKKDSINFSGLMNSPPISDSLNINLDFMTPEFIKSVKKDIRRKIWEENRKESLRNREKGMLY